MARINSDEYFLEMCKLISLRGTCFRRKVGCVLVDKHRFVLATGYNGVPRGMRHCTGDTKCPAADAPSGTMLDACQATHAEINALIQCKDTQSIHSLYCTAFPCIQCIKAILNTSCREIIAVEGYPHTTEIVGWLHNNDRLGTYTVDETMVRVTLRG